MTTVTRTKYRRNSISEIKYEYYNKSDLPINKTKSDKSDKSEKNRRFKSIEKNNREGSKVFPANDHPYMPTSSLFMMKKLNRESNKNVSSSLNSGSTSKNTFYKK